MRTLRREFVAIRVRENEAREHEKEGNSRAPAVDEMEERNGRIEEFEFAVMRQDDGQRRKKADARQRRNDAVGLSGRRSHWALILKRMRQKFPHRQFSLTVRHHLLSGCTPRCRKTPRHWPSDPRCALCTGTDSLLRLMKHVLSR